MDEESGGWQVEKYMAIQFKQRFDSNLEITVIISNQSGNDNIYHLNKNEIIQLLTQKSEL